MEDPMRSLTTAGAAFLGLLLLVRAAGAQVPDGFGSLARVALSAVVTITAPDVSSAALFDDTGPPDELLNDLFGGLLKGRRQAVAAGVILDPDGLVITSAHAIAGAGDIEATAADGVSRKATEHVLRTSSPAGDIIREINQQPTRTMADFERLVDGVKPGDWLALLVQRGQAAVYVAVEARETSIYAIPDRRRP
jgi:S1-C subfamily serine protease